MKRRIFRIRFCLWLLLAWTALNFEASAFSAEPTVSAISLKDSSVRLGGAFTATFSGTSLGDQTYFDVRVLDPAGDEQVASNWQRGASAVHGVPVGTDPGIWKMTGVRAHENLDDHSQPFTAVSMSLDVSALVVTELQLNPGSVGLDSSFSATVSGTNLTADTYLDVQFRAPCSDQDLVVLNWQRGTSATHSVPATTDTGIWTVTGIWAHQDINDHSRDFAPFSTILRIDPPNLIPFNGRVTSIAVAPSRSATVYAATAGSGVYKTCDAGQNWGPAGGSLPTAEIQTLAIDPSNPAVLYAGTRIGVLKSVDGGNTWNAPSEPAVAPVRSLAIDPQRPATIYAGTEHNGLFKSLDGGLRWILYDFGMPPGAVIQSLVVDPVNSDIVYAGTDVGGTIPRISARVFKTSDGGAHWEAGSVLGSSPGAQTINALIVDPKDTSVIYAGTLNPDEGVSNQAGVFKSKDGGRTWAGLPGVWGEGHRYIRSLVIDPINSSNIYATSTSGEFWRSTDAGATGKQTVFAFRSFTARVLAIDPAHPSTLYAGDVSGKGVVKSTNAGESWQPLDVH
jgi:photosystem II stability/assembly factor-like uncharacterized protein